MDKMRRSESEKFFDVCGQNYLRVFHIKFAFNISTKRIRGIDMNSNFVIATHSYMDQYMSSILKASVLNINNAPHKYQTTWYKMGSKQMECRVLL
jgi:hypothetical protein